MLHGQQQLWDRNLPLAPENTINRAIPVLQKLTRHEGRAMSPHEDKGV